MSEHITHSFNHDQIIALLPWYVNQTLDNTDRRKVANHLEHCASCQREVQFLTSLTVAVQNESEMKQPTHADINNSLANVMARIDASAQPRNQKALSVFRLQQKLSEVLRFFTTLSFPQWSATALVALLVAVSGYQLYNRQADYDYSVLSSADTENRAIQLSVEMTSTANQQRIQSLVQSEVEELQQPISIETNSAGALIITFGDPIGVSDLSKLVNALENEASIERVEVLP